MNRLALVVASLVLYASNSYGADSAAAARVAHVRIAGQQYLRLGDWAKANGLELHWVKRDESVQLTSHAARVVLTIDSRETQVNGIAVWLSFPVVQNSGVVYLAQLDADTALRPLLSPTRDPAGFKISSICLDPGHGGKDPGYCVGVNQEKKYTLLLAKEVRQQLERAGFKVTLTRTTDSFIELENRPEIAQRRHADLFVSLHFNSAETGRDNVQGAQVFCLTPPGASSTNARGEGGGAGWFAGNRNNNKNLLLAYEVQQALVRDLAVEDRGVRRARFAVLRDATMPAVLVEAGFMSHPVEGKKIFTAAYREKLAQAIVAGVLTYKRAVEQR